jgi:hypothetical protein
MSRTIKTNSGSEFITNISNEQFIGVLCKEVGAKYDSDFIGTTMAYDMTEEEANDAAYRITSFLSRERYFRFFEKIKPLFFDEDASIYTFVGSVEDIIDKLKQSKGYECL